MLGRVIVMGIGLLATGAAWAQGGVVVGAPSGTRQVAPPPPPPVGFRIRVAPPAPRFESMPVAPSARHVWVKGYWGWDGRGHVWVPGRWELPPQASARWIEGRWVQSGVEWVWEGGRWEGAPQPGVGYTPPPRPVVVSPPPPPPPVYTPPVVTAPPPPTPLPPPIYTRPAGTTVRADDIKARVIRARVVWAESIKCNGGRIGRYIPTREDSWERAQGRQDIRVPELQVDTIYAEDIKCDWIEAEEVHAEKARVGHQRYDRRDDDDRGGHGHGQGHGNR